MTSPSGAVQETVLVRSDICDTACDRTLGMATLKTLAGFSSSRALSHTVSILLLLFLGQFAQGQGPGNNIVTMAVVEESAVGVVVGTLPLINGYTYRLEQPSSLFELDQDNRVLRTKVRIDREELASDTVELFMEGTVPNEPLSIDPIEVRISILDINDNAPRFEQSVVSESFQEDAPGQQQLLVTAVDPDKDMNGTVVEYRIISGNDNGLFRLIPPSDETPFMFLVAEGSLDRETKDFYQLNISARDGGETPRFGYLHLNIDITDVNDRPPIFDPSEYEAEVRERADVGTAVIRVEASDDDIGENAEIFYSVTDSSGQFMIEERTGVIRTLTSPLQCSRPSCGTLRSAGSLECDPNSCLLTVEARDGGRTPLDGRAYISVTIIDENDHDPIITFQPTAPDPQTGAATINENATGLRVASISVTDADRGVNGQTRVEIISGNDAGHFDLVTLATPSTTINYIQVTGALDRETIPRYNLTIKAVDMGSPPRSSTAHLIIIVNDANDHSPVFEQAEYYTRMSELAMPGSFVASVKAVDEDSGPNSQLAYTIVSGNEQGWFGINDVTGLVTSRVALDHEVSTRVVLNISANDSGATPHRNFTRLVIDILDENDMAPRFSNPSTNVQVDENNSPGHVLGTLTAEDFDSGVNGTVTYVIHPDTELVYPGVFQVDSDSGRVKAVILLDHETKSFYTIKVMAKDGGSPSLSSTAIMYLTVNDLNDNVPEFHPTSYYVNVLETDPAGMSVVQVSATDSDSGSYGRLTYRLTSADFGSFSIDSNTGIITTTTVLRRSVGSSYTLRVAARDGGNRDSEDEADINIIVANINDPAPRFPSLTTTFNIPEDHAEQTPSLDQRVGQVQATGVGGGSVIYFITKGDPFQVFSIDSTGEIRRAKVVDREERQEYVLTVIATTGSRFGETTVIIRISDVNDNSPRFRVTASQTTVMENWPAGANIFLAGAEDADAGTNALLVYTLHSDDDPDEVFGIEQGTGIISLQKPASQLLSEQVTLTVTARDSGTPQRTDSIDIVIMVQDVNDHTPIFPRNVYSIAVQESREVNEVVMTFVATDTDKGRNGELVYSIVRGNEEKKFGIFPDGTLFIAHSLDRETRDMYMLTVQVQDCGDIPRSSSANITVYILDANDNSPIFTNASYTFSVLENRPVGTFVGSVKANDDDLGQNAELLYSLTEGNANFTIDPITGALYTKRPFDREYVMDTSSVEFYVVDVFATDGGSPKLRGKTTVRVFIGDVNDNPPTFARAVFSDSVREDAGVDTRVIKMTATDADVGANGAVTYVITEGNEGGKFRVAETTGEVTVAGRLDRETQDRYVLTIVATDTGADVQLSSSAQVSITVTDFNDNVPHFISTVRELSVVETTPIGQLLTVFQGRDMDLGNNAKMYFSIDGGNEDDVFKMDGFTGNLYLKRQLDYETKQKYLLNISVTDEGHQPSLSSNIFFNITVIDANDNAPMFKDGFRTVSYPEGTSSGLVVTLRATDRDSGDFGTVRFAIVSQDPNDGLFRIDATSGAISVTGALDRETTDYYRLVITATDQASSPSMRRSTQKSLNVRVEDVNDNSPVFRSPPAYVIDSTKRRGQIVAEVFADDADTDANGRVTYSLHSHTSLFSMHTTTGQISLQQDLPSTPYTYSLRVRATDSGGPSQSDRRSAETTITFVLTTTSESGPAFTGQPYSGDVSEHDQPSTSLFRVFASGTRSGITVEYYLTGVISEGVQRGAVFRVDGATGVVSNTVRLDREVLGNVITLDITALETGAATPRTQTTQVSVRAALFVPSLSFLLVFLVLVSLSS